MINDFSKYDKFRAEKEIDFMIKTVVKPSDIVQTSEFGDIVDCFNTSSRELEAMIDSGTMSPEYMNIKMESNY